MISDLNKEEVITLNALISKADISRTNKNNPYLSLSLEDKSGILDAKFWNLTEEQVQEWKVGDIVKVSGDLIRYRNAWQLKVRTMEHLPDEKVTDYVQSAPLSEEDMKREIDQVVAEMKNPVIRDVTSEMMTMAGEAFYQWPAAVRNHHNFPGGLAWHSLSMIRLAENIVKQYEFLDPDLLYAGILLHDMGKIEELSSAVLPEYTSEGNLLGHISIIAGWLDRVAVALDAEKTEEVMLLKHMVLSHHGKMEYGSPVLPMIPEAEVLTLLDNLDARMFMMKQALEPVAPGCFGPRVMALDNRMLYKRKGSGQS